MKKRNAYPNAVNINASTEFPYLVRTAKDHVFSDGTVGFGVFHWHEDLQFIYVIEGEVCVKTLENEVIISSGEGAFVNKNVIHYSIGKSATCSYKLFRFPEKFLSFYSGSPAEALTHAFTRNTNVTLVPLNKSEKWCVDALMILKSLVKIEEENKNDKYYASQVLISLSQLWLTLISNMDIPKQLPDDTARKRIGLVLKFIERNYQEDITLDDIAASANISKSEVIRCFHNILDTTPYKYLMDYRLSKAVDMLTDTEMSIREIASCTGFNHQSYFGKCFKEKTGMSPIKFRKTKN